MTTRLFDRIRRITHPTELDSRSEVALVHAVRLAADAGAELDVLHVDPEAAKIDSSAFPDVEKLLGGWGEARDGLRTQYIAAFGRNPVEAVVAHLEERPGDLVVLATRRRDGLDRWLHREVAGKIARQTPAPTLFVPFDVEGFVSPSTGVASLRRVLLPVDWSPRPQVAVEAVAMIVATLGLEGLEVTLLHVGGSELEFPTVDFQAWPSLRWRRRLGEGDVVETILAVAAELEADLVAMPTHGHDGFMDALRGSTTEQVLRRARCPVLSVPALAG